MNKKDGPKPEESGPVTPIAETGPTTASNAPPPISDEERARIRAQKADKALTEALGWIAANRKSFDAGIRRLEAIADDYPNSGAARRALKKAGDLRMAREAKKARAERPKIDTDDLKVRWEMARRMLARFLVEQADGKLKVLKADARSTPWLQKAKDEIEAKEHIEYLRASLVHAINASNGVPYRKLKASHPEGTIHSADVGGFHVRGADGKEFTRAWGDLVGPEIFGLAEACLPQNKSISFALGVYFVRAGMEKEARDQFDITRLMQSAGEYNDRIERLGK